MVNGVIYARVSTEEQAERALSIPSQIEACKRYAEQNKIQIVDIYIDAGKSATSTEEREAFNRLIIDAKTSKKFEVILVYNFSRFSRNEIDSLVYENLLEKLGIKLISVTQPLPEDNAIRTLVRGIFRTIDSWYAINASQEAKRGLEEAAKRGQYTGGVVPLGYRLIEKDGKKFLDIDPETAPIVQKIFRMAYEGYSYYDIIHELDKTVPPPKSKYWTKSTLYSILHNPVYIGAKVYNRRLNGTRASPDKWIIAKDVYPAIIDKQIFESVQRKVVKNKPRHDNSALLSGFVFCKYCGSKMWYSGIYKKGKKYGSYICSKRVENGSCNTPSISASLLEDAIIQLIQKIVSLDDIDEYIERAKIKQRRLIEKQELDKLRKQLERVNNGIKNLIRTIELIGNVEEVSDRLKSLLEEQEQLESTIQEKEKQLAYVYVPTREELVRAIEEAKNSLEDKDSFRELIRLFIDKITVDTINKSADITVKFGGSYRGQLVAPRHSEPIPYTFMRKVKLA